TLQKAKQREVAADRSRRIGIHELRQSGRINRTEIGRDIEVAIQNQLGFAEVRIPAVKSALDRVSDREGNGGKSVIGSDINVFIGPPSELGDGKDQDAIAITVGLHIRVEQGNGVADRLEE